MEPNNTNIRIPLDESENNNNNNNNINEIGDNNSKYIIYIKKFDFS